MDDKRYFDLTASLKQALDLHIDIEEDSEEEEDDLKPEYVCPFCFDDFDLVGFCCHMDNGHPIEVKSGICPVCAKKRLRNGGSLAALSLLRKRSEEEYDDRYVEKTSSVVSSSGIAADPMLSSLIYNAPPADVPEIQQSSSTTEANVGEESSDKISLGRIIPPSPLSNKDQEEKARRCEFVQGLLYSTFLDDGL